MAKDRQPLRLAVLIDGENISAAHADKLFNQVAKLGELGDRRVYAKLGSAWAAALSRHAISFRPVGHTGKNSADIALVIDAMDLIHDAAMNCLCIASTDSDFSALAVRARQKGIKVIGFGQASETSPFRQACDEYHVLRTSANAARVAAVPKKKEPLTVQDQPVPQIVSILQGMAEVGSWAQLDMLGQRLRAAKPPVLYKGQLKTVLQRSGKVEIKGGPGQTVMVRLRKAVP